MQGGKAAIAKQNSYPGAEYKSWIHIQHIAVFKQIKSTYLPLVHLASDVSLQMSVRVFWWKRSGETPEGGRRIGACSTATKILLAIFPDLAHSLPWIIQFSPEVPASNLPAPGVVWWPATVDVELPGSYSIGSEPSAIGVALAKTLTVRSISIRSW